MGLEDNTAFYGQEKKLWVNIAICLSSPRPFVSQTSEASTPFERIKRGISVLIKKSVVLHYFRYNATIFKVQTYVLYVAREKYVLESIFVFNFVPPDMSVFLPQPCSIFCVNLNTRTFWCIKTSYKIYDFFLFQVSTN